VAVGMALPHSSICSRTPALTLYQTCCLRSGGQLSYMALLLERSRWMLTKSSYALIHSGGQSSSSSLRTFLEDLPVGVPPWELSLSLRAACAGRLVVMVLSCDPNMWSSCSSLCHSMAGNASWATGEEG
jgi:hypothetical protein